MTDSYNRIVMTNCRLCIKDTFHLSRLFLFTIRSSLPTNFSIITITPKECVVVEQRTGTNYLTEFFMEVFIIIVRDIKTNAWRPIPNLVRRTQPRALALFCPICSEINAILYKFGGVTYQNVSNCIMLYFLTLLLCWLKS